MPSCPTPDNTIPMITSLCVCFLVLLVIGLFLFLYYATVPSIVTAIANSEAYILSIVEPEVDPEA
jgi:fructose-specific phosphotransferase system IIC component